MNARDLSHFCSGFAAGTALLGILVLALLPSKACAQERYTAGLHLATWHDSDNLSGRNRGVYLRSPDGWTVGVYRNSYRRDSVYAGRSFTRPHRAGDIGLIVGAVTGYPAGTLPLVAPSVRLGPARLTLIPKVHKAQTATGVHLSIEF